MPVLVTSSSAAAATVCSAAGRSTAICTAVYRLTGNTFLAQASDAIIVRPLRVALIVGSVLFVINHLDEVLRGQATSAVWMKGAITYLVPFCVANLGVLIATRRQS